MGISKDKRAEGLHFLHLQKHSLSDKLITIQLSLIAPYYSVVQKQWNDLTLNLEKKKKKKSVP